MLIGGKQRERSQKPSPPDTSIHRLSTLVSTVWANAILSGQATIYIDLTTEDGGDL